MDAARSGNLFRLHHSSKTPHRLGAAITCDPDPAGIAIALKAAELWRERGIAWLPWKMAATDLAALRARKLLTDVDRLQLASLQQDTALPAQLAELADWMREHGEKGEQEGYL